MAVILSARYAHAFVMLRRGEPMTKPPSVDEIKANLRESGGRPYVLKTPAGIEIHANDEADHARAMEAIAHIGRVAPNAFMPGTPTPPPQVLKRISLSEAKDKWEKAIKNIHPKTIGAKKRAVQDLIDWKQGDLDRAAAEISGDPAAKASPVFVDEIDSLECGEWFIYLRGLRKADPDNPGQMIPSYSPTTINNKFIYAGIFFKWAMTNGYYPKGDTPPTEGHSNVPKKEKRARAKSHGAQAFDPVQVALMFRPEHYQTMRSLAARWMPLLLLYTGARSNEIGRLELDDIYEHPKNCAPGEGCKVLSFSLVGHHKSLKTDDSTRLTPIHPALIELGFWDYVAQRKRAQVVASTTLKEAWRAKLPAAELEPLQAAAREAEKLFPLLTFEAQNGPANAPQSAFRRLLKRAGIKARGAGKMGHHSFRDTVIDTLKQAGVRKEVWQEYVGHENESENASAYEQMFSPAALAAQCHPALDFRLDVNGLKRLFTSADDVSVMDVYVELAPQGSRVRKPKPRA